MSHVLEITELRKIYRPGTGRQVVAVDGFDLSLEAGMVIGLLGPNGAGKTTIIKCCLGLVIPSSGTIRVAGYDLWRQPVQARLRVAAVLEGSRNVYWRHSVIENLRFFANLHGYSWAAARPRAEELLERLDLADRRTALVGELSRGMQQKVAVACALVRRCPLVLLDEPTLGLDVETARELERLIIELAREQGTTVVVSSHQMDLVERICRRVAILRKGRLVVNDSVTNLLDIFAARAYRFTLENPPGIEQRQELLSRFPGVCFDDAAGAFRLEVMDAGEFYDLMEFMRQAGLRVAQIDREVPDLGEVFLQVIRGEGSFA